MPGSTSALVLSKPGPLRDSLVALLNAMPRIKSVHQADDAAMALRLIEATAPALILLDSGLPNGEAWIVLDRVQISWPWIRCVVLSDSVQHRQQAEQAGATHALLKGYPAAKLSAAIEKLLRALDVVGATRVVE